MRTTSNSRARWRWVGILAVAVVAASACEVADPTPSAVVPGDWGADLRPRYADVLYLPGGLVGCEGAGTPDEACGGSHTLDVYPSSAGGSRGTIVWIHGGGFTGGDKLVEPPGPIRRLTEQGWGVVSINYRLANRPSGRFPAAVADVSAALRWVRANGAERGLDTRRLVVGGYSAGGTLAALAGTTGNANQPIFAGVPPLSGWISMAGIVDFNAGPMSRGWGGYWGVEADQRQLASAVSWWDPTDPQGWLIHGDLDDTVEIANATNLMGIASPSGRVQLDTVDRFADGTEQNALARGHLPMWGMNPDALAAWLNQLPALDGYASPVGRLANVFVDPAGSVQLTGWALDPDTTQPIEVRVSVDGEDRASTTADGWHHGASRTHPLHGTNHGFVVTVPTLSAGHHLVCVRAVNAHAGTRDPLMGCRTIAVGDGSPKGS